MQKAHMLCAMTTMRLVPNTGDELPSQQIARRIRGLMAENMIDGVTLAEAIGMNQASFSRRYSGKIDWTFDEVGRVARALGVSFNDLCAIRDSNPEPADSESGAPKLVDLGGRVVANVTDLAKVRSRIPDLVRARPVLALVQGGAA